MMSSELDILLVGYNEERFTTEIRQAFRHWQVYSCSAPHALYGRKFRRVYVTAGAEGHPNWRNVYAKLVALTEGEPGKIVAFSKYRPEYDVQSYEDAKLLRTIRRSRHADA